MSNLDATRNNTVKGSLFTVPITLLHDGNLLDDFLQIRLDRNLLDGHHLTRLLMDGLKHAAIGATDTNKSYD